MAERKYTQYVNKMRRGNGKGADDFEGRITPYPMTFDKEVYKSSPLRMEVFHIYGAGTGFASGGMFEMDIPGVGKKEFPDLPMKHTVDELFLFHGMNPQDPTELSGVVEYWLGEGGEAEKFTITEPTVVYVPAGLVHCPIFFRKVDKPFLMVIVLLGSLSGLEGTELVSLPPAFKR